MCEFVYIFKCFKLFTKHDDQFTLTIHVYHSESYVLTPKL